MKTEKAMNHTYLHAVAATRACLTLLTLTLYFTAIHNGVQL